MGSGVNVSGLGYPEYGMHYHAVKRAQQYDLWRRELKFESLPELIASMEEAALLLGEAPEKYFDDCFKAWNGD